MANPYARYPDGSQPLAIPGAAMPLSGQYTSENLERLGIHENPRLVSGLMDFIKRNRVDDDGFFLRFFSDTARKNSFHGRCLETKLGLCEFAA